jgi:tRNA threonylcarbamoyladenosine biosynthesis protein TsaE
LLAGGDWIGLTGELGAGKTCLTQGLALGLGVGPEVAVTSPTFVLHQTYPGRIPLHHLDLYRLCEAEELFEIGYQELLEGEGACVVEWFERIQGAQPGRGVTGRLELTDDTSRIIELDGIDSRGSELLLNLEKLLET